MVQLFDVATGRSISRFLGAAGPIISVGFDTTGRLVVTGGPDGTTRLWDASTGNQFGTTFPGPDGIWTAAMYTPDGSQIVSVYSDGTVSVWPATYQAWAAHACAVAGRNLTPSEWAAFVPDRPYEAVCPRRTG